MKKILVLCLTAVLCLCCLTACGERKWKCSDTHHWILSPQIGDNTGEIYFYGKHIDDNHDLRCDVCGYNFGHQGREFYYVSGYDGHCEHMIGESCDGSCQKSPHEDWDADMFCDICGYEMELRVVNDMLRNQAGCEWLNDVSAENIAEIKMISGGGGPLPPISFTHISSTTDKAVISSIFKDYYLLEVRSVFEERTQIDDGGYFTVQFVLNNGETKQLYFINGDFYHDGNDKYFELVRLPVFQDGTNFVSRFGLETWYDHCQLHLIDGTPVCEIPVFELEFNILTDDIYLGAETPTHFIEINGERLYFIKDCYFYINDDRSVYYDLVGKNLEELIYDYTVLPD